MISSSVRRSPSTSASSSADVRSSLGFLRRSATMLGVVDHQVGRGLHGRRRHVGQALLAVHDAVGQGADAGPVRLGHPHEFGDHIHRQLAGELVDVVETVRLQSGVEVLHGDLGDARLEFANAPRGEAFRHQSAQPQVRGIVEREEGHHLVRVQGARDRVERDAVLVRQRRAVAEALQHVGMPRQRPELQFVVAIERRLVAQPLVVRVRIFVEVVVVRVEHQFAGRLRFTRSSPRMRPTT